MRAPRQRQMIRGHQLQIAAQLLDRLRILSLLLPQQRAVQEDARRQRVERLGFGQRGFRVRALSEHE